MNRQDVYERRQAAGRMEVAMLLAAGAALIGSVLALASAGWLSGLAFLILAAIAYGISRLFDLLAGSLRNENEAEVKGETARERGAHPGGGAPV